MQLHAKCPGIGAIVTQTVLQPAQIKARRGQRRAGGVSETGLHIAQLQALVTVLGDLLIFHVQCEEPFWFWFAAAVTSFTFMLLIFSLVYAFGDVGKAAAVVIVVLQIAGSSGSYPIEILPVIFSKGYIFFPFPYAINAMREALCGTYGHDFLRYTAELLEFAAVALAIGLLVRKPFMGMNKFVSEKLEETEVL